MDLTNQTITEIMAAMGALYAAIRTCWLAFKALRGKVTGLRG